MSWLIPHPCASAIPRFSTLISHSLTIELRMTWESHDSHCWNNNQGKQSASNYYRAVKGVYNCVQMAQKNIVYVQIHENLNALQTDGMCQSSLVILHRSHETDAVELWQE